MSKELKQRMVRGDFVGTAIVDGTSCNVFTDKGHFSLQFNGKFVRHVKKSVLRMAGIFVDKKKTYGRLGFVGCPKR